MRTLSDPTYFNWSIKRMHLSRSFKTCRDQVWYNENHQLCNEMKDGDRYSNDKGGMFSCSLLTNDETLSIVQGNYRSFRLNLRTLKVWNLYKWWFLQVLYALSRYIRDNYLILKAFCTSSLRNNLRKRKCDSNWENSSNSNRTHGKLLKLQASDLLSHPQCKSNHGFKPKYQTVKIEKASDTVCLRINFFRYVLYRFLWRAEWVKKGSISS